MSASYHIDEGALRRLVQDEATTLVREGQRVVLNSAKLRSPVDTGQLRGSHRASSITIAGDKISGEVIAAQDYAMPVHEGTDPHIIRPKRAKVLAWGKGEGRVFARSVNHPGTKARPWLLNAADAEAPRIGFRVTPGG